ncbi:MAG: hypothetical protein IE909_11940 [Campylobacterales bacterium]|nr:hypothetical protein [Campylobacterales bacterium]
MLFEIISHEAIINGHNMSMEENIISSQSLQLYALQLFLYKRDFTNHLQRAIEMKEELTKIYKKSNNTIAILIIPRYNFILYYLCSAHGEHGSAIFFRPPDHGLNEI